MERKIVLITGASDGIGKETAKQLAAMGHHVLIHGRSPQKTSTACEEIKRTTGNDNVEYYLADFDSLENVRQLANTIRAKYDHLDVLINNAGAQFGNLRQISADGHEKTIQINLLAPFLLTNLLLDRLAKSPAARVVTVSSGAHKMGGKPLLDDMDLANHYSMARAYGLSKLYAIWMMWHYAHELQERGISNITFNIVHPGSADTSLGRVSTQDCWSRVLYLLWKPLMNSIPQGAWSSVYAATDDRLAGISGKYIGPNGEEKPSMCRYSKANEQRVWDWCVEQTTAFIQNDEKR